ncbi:glycogen synthase kinase 3 beta [Nematocida sp. AWRm77]|nr:glycogen synthase kinase 3 beta [Nematocida sp. AWRm77]
MDETRASVICAGKEVETEIVYQQVKKVGQGAFGEVFHIVLRDGTEYALKIVFEHSEYINRELEILKMIDHPSIIKLYWYFHRERTARGAYLGVIIDYVKHDLQSVIARGYVFSREEMFVYGVRLLEGIEFLHGHGIAHRDVKPSNILIDTKERVLKICDLGSAKKIRKSERNINYICSRNYRAPEIHKGLVYDVSMDVWSAGCVLAEMLTHRLLFQGESASEFIEKFEALEESIGTHILSLSKREDLADFLLVVVRMLVVNPKQRITAREARITLQNLSR